MCVLWDVRALIRPRTNRQPQAITTLDLVNIWSSAAEFSTHDVLFNVHTWVTYQRLKAMFPMPTRDVCQLVHWRVVEDHKCVRACVRIAGL